MSHLQGIARIEEMLEDGGAPLSDAQKVLTLRAALASAQRRAYQAELQLEQLQAELARINQGMVERAG